MSAKVIDGTKVAARVRDEIATAVAEMKEKHNYTPGLATVLVDGFETERLQTPAKGMSPSAPNPNTTSFGNGPSQCRLPFASR